jgi:drug/metabolite transporter (DMT)-like permease
VTPARRLQLAAERQPVALVGLGVLLYASGPVLVAGVGVSGPVVSFWRLWFGVAVLGVVTLVYVRMTGRLPTRRGWTWSLRCGLAFGVHQLLFMSAIKMTSVVDVTLMQVLQPILVAVLAVRMFDERPGVRFRVWSAVAVVGAGVVAVAGSAGPEGDPAGIAFAMLNVAFFALYFVWSKQARADIDVVPFLWGVTVVAAVGVSLFVVVAGESPGAADRADLLAALAIAVGPGAMGHFVSTWPLRWVAANVPPLLQLAIPFIAGFLAWVFVDEGITLAHLAGGALTIIGVAGAVLSPAGRRMVAREEAELASGGG